MSFHGTARLSAKLAGLLPLFVVGLAAQSIAAKLHPPLTRKLPVPFHRGICRILGINVVMRGPLPPEGALLVGNHVSWLDIPVLGSVMPLSFIAKSEVAGWPAFGTLARLQRTVFVNRARRTATGEATDTISTRLKDGDRMVLFAEGTTSDGQRVLPFRSALIGAAHDDDSNAPVVPFAIHYLRRGGLPLTRRDMPELAWYGDMDLMPHLRDLLRGGPIDVAVTFGPVMPADNTDRKSIARAAETFARRARSPGFEKSGDPS